MSHTRRRFPRLFALAAAVLAATACGKSAVEPEYPENISFAASLGVDLSQMTKTASGVYYQVKIPGEGGSVDNSTRITGEYKGWTPDGLLFGSGHLAAVTVGIDLIEGLGYGMAGMHKGETRLIVIPSELGYGPTPPAGTGIPKNSVLIYQITVTDYAQG